ncbi:MAG: hypothetical protein UC390_00330 [Peptococcaceae bacterium]|nr:hypothetical protein [Peptococcaceae bacterium]
MLLTPGCARWGDVCSCRCTTERGPHYLAAFQGKLAKLRSAEGGVVCAERSFILGECFQ